MNIAIASGKGGTGKTTVATNMAAALARAGQDAAYLDCDVEEPNGHIFLKPKISGEELVAAHVPEVDLDACSKCGQCGEICQYSAIVVIAGKVLTFPELCHGCAGCWLVCPEHAITESKRKTGVVQWGVSDHGAGLEFIHGLIDVGEVMSPPVIKQVKARVGQGKINIIDVPPGTSCPVITAVKGSDYLVLVTEPTPFGLNDLKLAVGMARELDMPFSVLINRADSGDDQVKRYCKEQDIRVIMEIPDDRRIAEAYSRGEMVVDAVAEYADRFLGLYEHIREEVGGE